MSPTLEQTRFIVAARSADFTVPYLLARIDLIKPL
jgi:hypothetical protein